MWGHGMWALCWFHPYPALAQHYHKLVGIMWLPSTWLQKLNDKWCYLPEREWVNVWLLASTQPPDFWQQSEAKWLCLCSIWMNCVLFMWPCLPSAWTLPCPSLRQGDSAQTTTLGHQGLWWPIEYSPKEWRQEVDHPWRTLFLWRKFFTILGGLRHLGKREVAPDTPEEIEANLQWEKVCELTGWANCANISKCQGHEIYLSKYHFISAGLPD